jgi:hypothetical protein
VTDTFTIIIDIPIVVSEEKERAPSSLAPADINSPFQNAKSRSKAAAAMPVSQWVMFSFTSLAQCFHNHDTYAASWDFVLHVPPL